MLSTSPGVIHLSTPAGPVYLALDDQPVPDANGPVLTRSEIDSLLSLACRIAKPDHTKLTLWRELRALLALKRALPEGSPATFVPRAPARRPHEQLTLF